MIKKGEQILIINDPAVFPVIFYNRDATGNTNFGSNSEGLQYPSAGAYTLTGSDNAPTSYTLSASNNLERIGIPNFNMNFDALRVTRALRYNTIAARAERAAIQLSGTALAVGSEIALKITLRSRDKYLSEYNTVFADGEIVMYRDVVVTTATLAGIAASIAAVINNSTQRPANENALMNITADGISTNTTSTALVSQVVQLTPVLGIEIADITITQPSGSAMVATFVPARTTLTGTLTGTTTANVASYMGRGIYDRIKLDVMQTPYKVYPFANESTDGSQLPIKGATYTAFLISMKVTNQTHIAMGEMNSPSIEYFDYWIYVNNSCTATLLALSSWINSLNTLTTSGRKDIITATSPIADYVAAYTAWSAPQRIVLPTSGYNFTTGADVPTVLAANAVAGFEVTT